MFIFQLLILDGDRLKSDPIAVMDKVQMFLRLEPYFDYSIRLKYVLSSGCSQEGFRARTCKHVSFVLDIGHVLTWADFVFSNGVVN